MMIGCKEIDDYIKIVETEKFRTSKYVKLQCQRIKEEFAKGDIFVDKEQLKGYMTIGSMMFEKVYPWEKFLIALFQCTYKKVDGTPRWDWLLAEIGRGAGKDGVISWCSINAISKFNKISKYDVDICANNEEQATRPVLDIKDWLETPQYYERNKKSFKWNMEQVIGLKNRGRIKGHTNSPKGADGYRTGLLVMNELHAYTNFEQIKVFSTGLGKMPHPRVLNVTTNGEVPDGVLAEYLKEADEILLEGKPDNGKLYFICCLDDPSEVDDELNWYKANPSLAYNDSLLQRTRNEYLSWKRDPYSNSSFMSKRMNLPYKTGDKAVVDYEYIKATNKPLIDLTRKPCIVGVDLSRTTDMCSVSLLFKVGNNRYVINHNWICTASRDWEEIKVKDQFPKWVDQGLLTIVDDIEINPELIADWIQLQKSKYNILCVAIDDFRQSIFARALDKIGINRDNKNLKLVRPSDIAKVVPIIESIFLNGYYYWGDNPAMRWATNNTKCITWKTRNTDDSDLGNMIYAKIDKHTRKTDPFMSLVAAETCELMLPEQKVINTNLLRAVQRG